MSQPANRPPRFSMRVSAELTLSGRIATATTRNLSEGGVCLETDRQLAEGTELAMTLFVVEDEIEAEGKRGLSVQGTVQWSSEADVGFAAGIKFINISAAQKGALEAALKRLG